MQPLHIRPKTLPVICFGLQFLTIAISLEPSAADSIFRSNRPSKGIYPARPATASSTRPQCAQSTTLSFCLDDSTYPRDDIQRDINADDGTFYKMYADVANQSTASLVEDIGSDQEAKYDYAFYYGDKRNSLSGNPSREQPVYTNYVFRDDYYKDGGYVCPAFIDYTTLYQATNARGEWQYVVNVKPWTQTVRLEQCFYPMAPCSYMSTSFKTECVQKYSYQRLIAYEPQGRGLYMDVFRLPTSCSCHIRPSRLWQTGLPQPDASQIIDSSATYNSPLNAISNGFKPIRVRNPPPGVRFPAASQSSSSWFTKAQINPLNGMAASETTDTEMGPSQDTRLVERRRIRPDGLSLADITSDPEVAPSQFGFTDFREGGPIAQGPMRPPGPPPQQNANGPFRGGGPSQFQGDESRFEPSYSPGPNSGYENQNNGGRIQQAPGPQMWNNGPPDSGQYMQAPRNGPPAESYRMSQGPGYYDYNAAQHN